MMQIDVAGILALTVNDVIGESFALLGVKGTGKTTTAAVVVEELIGSVPLTIVDPEGEYFTLKEKFRLLVAGCGDNVEVEINADNAPALAEFAMKNRLSVILDISGYDLATGRLVLAAYLQKLWEVNYRSRLPHFVVVEEAREFIPQNGTTPVSEVLTRIALRGRKRGLGLIVVNQRSANISKDVLTQAGILLLHRVTHPTDIKVYQELIPLPANEVAARVRELKAGQLLFVRGDRVEKVTIRQRHTSHGGATPTLAGGSAPALKTIDDAMLRQLQKALGSAANAQPTQTPDQPAASAGKEKKPKPSDDAKENKKLRALLRQKDDLIQDLQRQLVAYKTNGWQIELPPAALSPNAVMVQSVDPDYKRQRMKFRALVADVQQQRQFHRQILSFLTVRDGDRLPVKEMARLLGLSPVTLLAHPPVWFVNKRLLATGDGRRAERQFYSTVRDTLANDFPALDTEAILAELLAVCA